MRTRFAPSPTGPLHLGHAYSAHYAWNLARKHDGAFLLRIEDTDLGRARQAWETLIYQDLQWLGMVWQGPVLRQSDNFPRYQIVLKHLFEMGLLYPCDCKRRDIQSALSAPQEGDHAALHGPDGLIYPGTCRARARELHKDNLLTFKALRLNVEKARMALSDAPLCYDEKGVEAGKKALQLSEMSNFFGDFCIARQGVGTSYHLSVVVDDADQAITDVVRGSDMAEASFIHVLLQRLLGYPTPRYHHHDLVRDENGKRLAKRDDARAISTYRQAGWRPRDLLKRAQSLRA